MILTKDLLDDLLSIENSIRSLTLVQNPNNLQIESFLRNLEKRRYSILNQIKLYNKTVIYGTQKIVTISDEYKAKFENNILKIYIPEVMPSYKNLKTHAYKNILLNIADKVKSYEGIFNSQVFIYIKIFDKVENWDIDNKFIKPIFDSLIVSNVIKDDNINNVFYCAKGEQGDNAHTEVYVTDVNNSVNLFRSMLV
jgi:hypothetical protein